MSLSDVLASVMSDSVEVEVRLSTTAAPEELWTYWLELAEVSKTAGELMIAIGQQWKDATDVVLERQLWTEYQSAARQYDVLSAWKDVVHSAYVFMTEGDVIALENGTPTPF